MTNKYEVWIAGNDCFRFTNDVEAVSFVEAFQKAIELMVSIQPQTIEKLEITSIAKLL